MSKIDSLASALKKIWKFHDITLHFSFSSKFLSNLKPFSHVKTSCIKWLNCCSLCHTDCVSLYFFNIWCLQMEVRRLARRARNMWSTNVIFVPRVFPQKVNFRGICETMKSMIRQDIKHLTSHHKPSLYDWRTDSRAVPYRRLWVIPLEDTDSNIVAYHFKSVYAPR